MVGTVRVQIKSLAAKLGCHRQGDIVRRVRKLPELNG
jgi:DNA-binding CsgD family transcriptional regulator